MDAGARCRMVGLVLGAGLAFALTRTFLFDYAPVVLALSLAIGVLVGAAVTPRPVRPRGAASLRPRRIRDYVPVHAVTAVVVLGVGLGIFAGVLARFPTPPSLDPHTVYARVYLPVSLGSTLGLLSTVAVSSGLVVWAIMRSPQAGIDAVDRAADDAWRRTTVHAIVNSCAALFALVFTVVAFWYADRQLDWRAGGSPPWGFGLAVIGSAGLALFARYAGAMLTAARMEIPRRPTEDEAGEQVMTLRVEE